MNILRLAGIATVLGLLAMMLFLKRRRPVESANAGGVI
jgi:hypothetical protein